MLVGGLNPGLGRSVGALLDRVRAPVSERRGDGVALGTQPAAPTSIPLALLSRILDHRRSTGIARAVTELGGGLRPLQTLASLGYLLAHPPPSEADDEDLANEPEAPLPPDAVHWARLAVAVYAPRERELLRALGSGFVREDILHAQLVTRDLLPAHVLVRDRAHRAIVLVLRGTATLTDLVTDLTGSIVDAITGVPVDSHGQGSSSAAAGGEPTSMPHPAASCGAEGGAALPVSASDVSAADAAPNDTADAASAAGDSANPPPASAATSSFSQSSCVSDHLVFGAHAGIAACTETFMGRAYSDEAGTKVVGKLILERLGRPFDENGRVVFVESGGAAAATDETGASATDAGDGVNAAGAEHAPSAASPDGLACLAHAHDSLALSGLAAIIYALKASCPALAEWPVVIAGHSLGAAVGALLTARLRIELARFYEQPSMADPPAPAASGDGIGPHPLAVLASSRAPVFSFVVAPPATVTPETAALLCLPTAALESLAASSSSSSSRAAPAAPCADPAQSHDSQDAPEPQTFPRAFPRSEGTFAGRPAVTALINSDDFIPRLTIGSVRALHDRLSDPALVSAANAQAVEDIRSVAEGVRTAVSERVASVHRQLEGVRASVTASSPAVAAVTSHISAVADRVAPAGEMIATGVSTFLRSFRREMAANTASQSASVPALEGAALHTDSIASTVPSAPAAAPSAGAGFRSGLGGLLTAGGLLSASPPTHRIIPGLLDNAVGAASLATAAAAAGSTGLVTAASRATRAAAAAKAHLKSHIRAKMPSARGDGSGGAADGSCEHDHDDAAAMYEALGGDPFSGLPMDQAAAAVDVDSGVAISNEALAGASSFVASVESEVAEDVAAALSDLEAVLNAGDDDGALYHDAMSSHDHDHEHGGEVTVEEGTSASAGVSAGAAPLSSPLARLASRSSLLGGGSAGGSVGGARPMLDASPSLTSRSRSSTYGLATSLSSASTAASPHFITAVGSAEAFPTSDGFNQPATGLPGATSAPDTYQQHAQQRLSDALVALMLHFACEQCEPSQSLVVPGRIYHITRISSKASPTAEAEMGGAASAQAGAAASTGAAARSSRASSPPRNRAHHSTVGRSPLRPILTGGGGSLAGITAESPVSPRLARAIQKLAQRTGSPLGGLQPGTPVADVAAGAQSPANSGTPLFSPETTAAVHRALVEALGTAQAAQTATPDASAVRLHLAPASVAADAAPGEETPQPPVGGVAGSGARLEWPPVSTDGASAAADFATMPLINAAAAASDTPPLTTEEVTTATSPPEVVAAAVEATALSGSYRVHVVRPSRFVSIRVTRDMLEDHDRRTVYAVVAALHALQQPHASA